MVTATATTAETASASTEKRRFSFMGGLLHFGKGGVVGDIGRRQRLEFPSGAGEEPNKKLEQQQARRLDTHHHALEHDDKNIADCQNDPIADPPAGVSTQKRRPEHWREPLKPAPQRLADGAAQADPRLDICALR